VVGLLVSCFCDRQQKGGGGPLAIETHQLMSAEVALNRKGVFSNEKSTKYICNLANTEMRGEPHSLKEIANKREVGAH